MGESSNEANTQQIKKQGQVGQYMRHVDRPSNALPSDLSTDRPTNGHSLSLTCIGARKKKKFKIKRVVKITNNEKIMKRKKKHWVETGKKMKE